MPTALPPHKNNEDIAPAADRFKMLKFAVQGNRSFGVSDIEIKRKGRSYTIDTLKELKRLYPRDRLYFIIGSDLLEYLSDWKDFDRITEMVEFVVAGRPGYSLERIPSGIKTMEAKAIEVSAFEVRQRVRQDKFYAYLVPQKVFDYIKKKKLYR